MTTTDRYELADSFCRDASLTGWLLDPVDTRDDPLVAAVPMDVMRTAALAKSVFDRCAAALLILLLSPVLLIIALAIKLSSRGPVLYRQLRVGRHGEVFTLFKFRSMFGSAAEHGEADASWASAELGEDGDGGFGIDRRTKVGAFIRRWYLDELPQLFNVIIGHMSLVGPRPERVAYVDRFAERVDGYRDRHRVRPGMTGWAQVNGLRGETSVNLRTAYDNDYAENWTFGLDLRILVRTVPSIFWAPQPDTDQLLSRRQPAS